MNAREFYDLVVRMREAQKLSAMSLDIDDLRGAWMLEDEVDAEIDRVTKILQRDEHRNNEHTYSR